MNKRYLKNNYKDLFVGLIFLIMPLLANGASKDNQNINYLFVQSAKKVDLMIEKSKNETGMYKIIIKNVEPKIAYFSDRPNRIAGKMDLEKFIALWSKESADSFLFDPPNAYLVGNEHNFFNKQINMVVELINQNYDKKSKTLTYTAKLLPNTQPIIKESLTLHNVMIFIDSVCLSCW